MYLQNLSAKQLHLCHVEASSFLAVFVEPTLLEACLVDVVFEWATHADWCDHDDVLLLQGKVKICHGKDVGMLQRAKEESSVCRLGSMCLGMAVDAQVHLTEVPPLSSFKLLLHPSWYIYIYITSIKHYLFPCWFIGCTVYVINICMTVSIKCSLMWACMDVCM